jgi:hypothetical protein
MLVTVFTILSKKFCCSDFILTLFALSRKYELRFIFEKKSTAASGFTGDGSIVTDFI